jgi:hypothetical protein
VTCLLHHCSPSEQFEVQKVKWLDLCHRASPGVGTECGQTFTPSEASSYLCRLASWLQQDRQDLHIPLKFNQRGRAGCKLLSSAAS